MKDDTKDEGESLPGLPMAIDVAPDELEKMQGLPLRAQQIGALLASGFRPVDIDNAFALKDGTARAYKSKYFVDNSISISPKTRDLIIAAYLRSKSLQLVNGITPEKIDKAGAGELAKSSTMLLQRARDLEGAGQSVDIGAQISNALSKLSQRVDSKQLA